MEMLARDPQQRPRDMQQVSEALRQALADTLSAEENAALIEEAAPAPLQAEASRPPFDRLKMGGAALLLLVLVALAVVWLRREQAPTLATAAPGWAVPAHHQALAPP
jgi:hypothetical protein